MTTKTQKKRKQTNKQKHKKIENKNRKQKQKKTGNKKKTQNKTLINLQINKTSYSPVSLYSNRGTPGYDQKQISLLVQSNDHIRLKTKQTAHSPYPPKSNVCMYTYNNCAYNKILIYFTYQALCEINYALINRM